MHNIYVKLFMIHRVQSRTKSASRSFRVALSLTLNIKQIVKLKLFIKGKIQHHPIHTQKITYLVLQC